MNRNDRFFMRQNMNLICRDEACSVYQMKNDSGDGTVTFYDYSKICQGVCKERFLKHAL